MDAHTNFITCALKQWCEVKSRKKLEREDIERIVSLLEEALLLAKPFEDREYAKREQERAERRQRHRVS